MKQFSKKNGMCPETHKAQLVEWRNEKQCFVSRVKDLLVSCPFHEVIVINARPLEFDSALNVIYKLDVGEVARLFLTFTREDLGCQYDWVLEAIKDALNEVYPQASEMKLVASHGDSRTYDAYIDYMI